MLRGHGHFADYHERFGYEETDLRSECGHNYIHLAARVLGLTKTKQRQNQACSLFPGHPQLALFNGDMVYDLVFKETNRGRGGDGGISWRKWSKKGQSFSSHVLVIPNASDRDRSLYNQLCNR